MRKASVIWFGSCAVFFVALVLVVGLGNPVTAVFSLVAYYWGAAAIGGAKNALDDERRGGRR